MASIILKHQTELTKICEDYGISYLAVFGSQARGDQTVDSDIDFLVDFKETPGLIRFIEAKHRLEKVFDRKVDLVTKNGVSKHLWPYIKKDLQVIYG